MAIFSKTDKQTSHAGNITTIAAGTKITGKIDIECMLHIDGELDGDISSNNVVKVGKSGVLKSNLTAQKLIITGRYIGTANCEAIEIISGAKAEGKLIAASLVIDADSSFQGESILRDQGQEQTKIIDFVAESNDRESKLEKTAE